jgi:hypothetical protein
MRVLAPLVIGLIVLTSAPSSAGVPRTIRLRFPPFQVAAGTIPEACVAVRVPTTVPLDIARIDIRLRGLKRPVATQHFLVYTYTGEQLSAFPAHGSAPVPSRGCLGFGPADRDRRQLVTSGTAPISRSAPLPGGALRLVPAGSDTPGVGFVLDGEWINPGTRDRTVSAVVVLHRASKKEVGRIATLFSDRSAEAGLRVPPCSAPPCDILSTEALPAGQAAAWGPGRPGAPATDVCVLTVTGQMHERGRFIGVDLVGADGQVHNPENGVQNPFDPTRKHLFGGFDWTDEGALVRPFRLAVGETLHYACWDDNGSSRAVRFGCEEVPAEIPGSIGAPAKSCSSAADCPPVDADYPGRTFTGVCRTANLVAGPTTDDEICRLDGFYTDASAGCGTP